MLEEEGLANVFARHDRHAEATRRAVRAWGLEILCQDPTEYSSSLTAVLMPAGHDADTLRKIDPRALRHVARHGPRRSSTGKVFRIGHLGDFNDLTLAGTLAGVEMGLDARRRAAPQGRRRGGDGVPRRGGEPRAGRSAARHRTSGQQGSTGTSTRSRDTP